MGAAVGRMRPTVLVLGLDNSGKTAIIDCLRKYNEFNEPPSVSNAGFDVHKILVNGMEMTLCDVSGL